MKITLLFLSTMMVISHQQYPVLNAERLLYSPYLQHFALRSYESKVDQSIPEGRVSFRYKGPIHLSPYNAQDISLNPTSVGTDYQDNSFNEGYLQDRGLYGIAPHSNVNARLFFGSGIETGNTNVVGGGLLRTTIVVSTSIVTTAFIQSCIPGSEFVAAAPPACRRKKRGADFIQFSPSEVQKVLTTELPSMALIPETRQWSADLDSSKLMINESARDKRLLFNIFFVTSTSTSYLFVPSTIKVTVKPAGIVPPAPGVLKCMPSGYVLC